MKFFPIILVTMLLAAFGTLLATILFPRRRPHCPGCLSPEVDEHGDEGICRQCGQRFDWAKRG
jgi:hypothetical protein